MSVMPDPKPEPRIVDPAAGQEKVRREGRCRLCRQPWGGALPVTRHHLVARSHGGDDVDDNLVPLCGDGTTGCHGEVEAHTAGYRERLRARLTQREIDYVIAKRGAAWLNSRKGYPVR